MNVWVKHGHVKVYNQKHQNIIKFDRLIIILHHQNLKVIVHLILHYDQLVVSEKNKSIFRFFFFYYENNVVKRFHIDFILIASMSQRINRKKRSTTNEKHKRRSKSGI